MNVLHIHLIAIGGAVMHNLALDLQACGYTVSGSDDEIYDPAKSRLLKAGLLPDSTGWNPGKISNDLDAVILGMHAHADNPELARALKLNIPVYSFPEFVSSRIQNKHRIVVCGSHGKTTTTAMIMHALDHHAIEFDYLVGGTIDGFERMVKISEKAGIVVLEGDEYLSSRLDDRPKMLHYRGHVVIVTGIAWDHMNVFPTKESYEYQFERLLEQSQIEQLIWCEEDVALEALVRKSPVAKKSGYRALPSNEQGEILWGGAAWPVDIFGEHNRSNAHAAMIACRSVGISEEIFLRALKSFRGVGKRLEKINTAPIVYRDFAHAPSKVRASTKAVRQRHGDVRMTALVELHTYSSLNKEFIGQYNGSVAASDHLIVYYDPVALQNKRLTGLDEDEVRSAFQHQNMIVCKRADHLQTSLEEALKSSDVLLIMSSGNLGRIDLDTLLRRFRK